MKTSILFGIALLCPLAALTAQTYTPFDAKTGLWETTSSTEISGMPAMPQLTPDQMAQIQKLPEAQRQKMEAMMAGRGGGGAPQKNTAKSCVTAETLRTGAGFAKNPVNSSCTNKIVNSSSSKVEIHVDCTPDKNTMNMRVSSDFTLERIDSEHVKMTGVSKTTGASASGDRSMEVKINSTSKWISSDCGDVKPVENK